MLICDRREQVLGTDSTVEVLEQGRVDMIVLANINRRIRALDEILKIFELADLRFRFKELHLLRGNTFMICEIV